MKRLLNGCKALIFFDSMKTLLKRLQTLYSYYFGSFKQALLAFVQGQRYTLNAHGKNLKTAPI